MASVENKGFSGFSERKVNPRLGHGEDSQGLYSVDRWGRKWYHVDHIDSYSGKIVFYSNKGRGSVAPYEEEVRNRRAKKLVEEKGIGIKEEGLGTIAPAGLDTAGEFPASNGLEKPHGKRVSHGGRHIWTRKK